MSRRSEGGRETQRSLDASLFPCFCPFGPWVSLSAPTHLGLSPIQPSPAGLGFPAQAPPISSPPPRPLPFCRLKGLISPAGKNRSAESLTGDRWATFFWPQRGRNGALRGIQMGPSRGCWLLAGPGGPYGACRGEAGRCRRGGLGAGAGSEAGGRGAGWRGRGLPPGRTRGERAAPTRAQEPGAGTRQPLHAPRPLPAPPTPLYNLSRTAPQEESAPRSKTAGFPRPRGYETITVQDPQLTTAGNHNFDFFYFPFPLAIKALQDPSL